MKDLDEREQKILGKQSTIILSLTTLVLIASSTYKIITTKTFDDVALELNLLIVIVVAYIILNMKNLRFFMPENSKGERLSTSQTKQAKQNRLQSYIVNAASLSVGFTILEAIAYYVFDIKDIVLESGMFASINATLLLTLLGGFLVFFLYNIITGEIAVKYYNKKFKDSDK